MTTTRFSAVFALLAAGFLASCGGSKGPSGVFKATLNGAQEVPAVTTSATGDATFTLTDNGTAMTYVVNFSGLSGPATLSHIHVGNAVTAGTVVVGFNPPAAASGTFTDKFTNANVIPRTTPIVVNTFEDIITQMRAGNIYVNVHTTKNGGGEIRGVLQEQ
jgi:hypothetical protein